MSAPRARVAAMWPFVALFAVARCNASPAGLPCVGGAATLHSPLYVPLTGAAVESVDILFVVDNSNSMSNNEQQFVRQFDALLAPLVSPPVDPTTMAPQFPPVKSLHIGVVSIDLGTPGSQVPSCAQSDVGDDGQLNPIRRGLAMRTHEPWTWATSGTRPARCTTDPNQYPAWLEFDATAARADPDYTANLRDDFVCNAFLTIGGCGLEQQIESAYRALVIHDAREAPGNASPNAGFVRDNALLAIVTLSDEEDGSVRDCRFAERGQPCTDATSVFDSSSPAWSSTDLNLRFYMYQPGTAQDPTWPIDRYIDPSHPMRGFTSLKPGRPERVIFAAITGVPNEIPLRAGSTDVNDVDWDALLDTDTMSAEGPISMRQANLDSSCPTRAVPACRREGTSYDPEHPQCDTSQQYFAWPSRRIVQVARRFAETYGNGAVSSICRADYGDAMRQFAGLIQRRLSGSCLPRELPYTVPTCTATRTTGCRRPTDAASVNCIVREVLPAGVTAASACTAARGRTPGPAQGGRDTCLVNQVPVVPGAAPTGDAQGFYYDTRVDQSSPGCARHIRLTANAAVTPGASATYECVQTEVSATPPPEACGGAGATGDRCDPIRPGGAATCSRTSGAQGCFFGTEVYLESGSRACRSGVCLAYRYDEPSDVTGSQRASHVYCSCRCGVPSSLQASVDPSTLCTCPESYACVPLADEAYPSALRGSYCVQRATVSP